MKTPWQRADATGNEHAHQSALFQWAAMAAWGGLACADDPLSYSKPGYAREKYGPQGGIETGFDRLKWLHAIHNQGHGDAVRGNRAKAEGVRAGVPDIFLPVRIRDFRVPLGTVIPTICCGLYIELKRPDSVGKKAGETSGEQDKWISYLREAGYKVEVCVGWLEARACLIEYLAYKGNLKPT